MRHLDLLDCMALNDEGQRNCESLCPSNPNHDCTMAKAPVIIPPLSEKDKERFFSFVRVVDSGCHEWQGKSNNKGYAQIALGGSRYYVHRVSHFLSSGEQTGGLHVLHKCDNPRCVNPDHLFLGTHSENMLDMYRKQRGNDFSGENSPQAVLTSHMVKEIRDTYARGGATQTQLATAYRVTQATIWYVLKRRTWRNV